MTRYDMIQDDMIWYGMMLSTLLQWLWLLSYDDGDGDDDDYYYISMKRVR